jgi:hypothetical protein
MHRCQGRSCRPPGMKARKLLLEGGSKIQGLFRGGNQGERRDAKSDQNLFQRVEIEGVNKPSPRWGARCRRGRPTGTSNTGGANAGLIPYTSELGILVPPQLEVCVCVCVCYYFPLQGDSPVPRGGQRCRTAARSTRPHALCTPSPTSRPPRPACIWPVRRGARPTLSLSLCGLCPLRKSPRSQSNPTP